MQTRSHAFTRATIRTSGPMAGSSFTSMLNLVSGKAASRSSSSGMGSRPLIRAAATSRCGIRAIRPDRSVVPVQGVIVEGDQTPSAVACASVSRYL